jgi:hypothetical protein
MDRPRYVIVEIPDGSLRVGLDESVQPPSTTEDPEVQDTQTFVKVNATCRLFTFMNMALIIFSFSSDPDVVGLANLVVSIYSTMISHTEINVSLHGMVILYIPISIAAFYSAIMAIYHITIFKWGQYVYYTVWFIMSAVSLVTLEHTVR